MSKLIESIEQEQITSLVVNGDGERLIPFVMGEVILDVDLAKGQISVDWEWD